MDKKNVNMVLAKEEVKKLKHSPSHHILNLFAKRKQSLHPEAEIKSHPLFCQMDVLRQHEEDYVWKEAVRWVKFEEVFEEEGKHWSKPHVSSFLMLSFTELEETLQTSALFLDMEADKISDVADKVVRRWVTEGKLTPRMRNHVKTKLLKTHKYQHEHGLLRHGHHSKSSFASFPSFTSLKDAEKSPQTNTHFMRKIPPDAEVVNIMVGEVSVLEVQLSAFVRLKEAVSLGDLTEVAKPTRFLFILLAPPDQIDECFQIGRCLGTLMTDEVFREVAYLSEDLEHLSAGIQDFVNHGTVLPPGSWDPKSRIEPPEEVPTLEFRKTHSNPLLEVEIGERPEVDATLQRTGRIFGGLVTDVRRKLKYYKSDFTDAFHLQCVASFIYLFLATLTPNVTFGGLLGKATDQYMGTMECILAAAITGVAFALFSGQPLNILGTTGPMLVLESILYTFCKDNSWDYLPIRFWVGMWTTLLIVIIVAFDLSALVRFITRFTEECFACLIALIFIYEAFAKVVEIEHEVPVQFRPASSQQSLECFCEINNLTNISAHIFNDPETDASHILPVRLSDLAWSRLNESNFLFSNTSVINRTACTENGGVLVGEGCDEYVPDAFFVSVLLFLGTFTIAIVLVKFRHSSFFPTIVRETVSDFGVLIAILVMVGVDAGMGLPTPKLNVPSTFTPTRPDRGWIVNPISEKNPWWMALAAVIPALLATILMFMDQQITAVIVNRKDHKLKKGAGYHLDMMVLAILTAVLSVLGLPWYVAATVSALAHVMSLKKQSECAAPGEKPTFLGVREQRVTALLVGILSGLAVLITSVLKYIPMAVLYGVFLYMGVAALEGMELVQRTMLYIMPQKYQPDYSYLRHVPLMKVHIFTLIQIVCLAVLWVFKTIKSISIVFPLMVLAICFIRKGLDFPFTQHDLGWLDVILPGIKKKEPKATQPKEEFTKVDTAGGSEQNGGISFISQHHHSVPNRLMHYLAGHKWSLRQALHPHSKHLHGKDDDKLKRSPSHIHDETEEDDHEEKERNSKILHSYKF